MSDSPRERINGFYASFDTESLHPRKQDYRTPFEKDRDRIIHISAFRRLQSKTQVFLSGEYDFYRTRLTHSLEVAQVGRSICNYLNRTSPHLNELDFFIDPALVEASCLAHDLGHPPFGHAGEAKLNELMHDHGGFEGNAQSLRILTGDISASPLDHKLLNPTRALIDSILKYKVLYEQAGRPERYFIYDSQQYILDFVFDGNSIPDSSIANSFRSIECEIMDWADDIAYSVADIADSIQAGFLNRETIEEWFRQQSPEFQEEHATIFATMQENFSLIDIHKTVANKIGEFITSTTIVERDHPKAKKTNRYRFQLQIDPKAQRESSFYKKLALEIVFLSPNLQQLEVKSEFFIERIFEALTKNYLGSLKKQKRMIPAYFESKILAEKTETEKLRRITDYIAGMTDDFAVRFYKRLFEPGFGSISDII